MADPAAHVRVVCNYPVQAECASRDLSKQYATFSAAAELALMDRANIPMDTKSQYMGSFQASANDNS